MISQDFQRFFNDDDNDDETMMTMITMMMMMMMMMIMMMMMMTMTLMIMFNKILTLSPASYKLLCPRGWRSFGRLSKFSRRSASTNGRV